ncbi:fructose-6-phosphate aldolase [Hyphobacterium sp. SN044]|uniref:fructose-6-phosphate aldolase n=1 Tax=Hyphobacterium sp. SN044 TaxID=2912575 RepID=UPI001F02BB34|nr:fructose-6-phosphate aldolase [Hyphobacterium sp. SN044]MCF8879893.1 fructose-6-phosphate aldolase [Hyphobacterium sp. SN044]
MQIFLDTADAALISAHAETGLVDGVTTNPSLVAKAGGDFIEGLQNICAAVDGPVSAEVVATDAATMIAEGQKLRTVADNIVVKLPLTFEGLKACAALTADGHPTNVTLCFSVSQALLAAKAGATFVSPFIGRLDDRGEDGLGLIQRIRAVYDEYGYETRILAASIRSVEHVEGSALAGADACTIPPAIFEKMIQHDLTDAGLATFLKDWEQSGRGAI